MYNGFHDSLGSQNGTAVETKQRKGGRAAIFRAHGANQAWGPTKAANVAAQIAELDLASTQTI